MRLQNLLIGVLAILFVGVAGMFYYQNFYAKSLEDKNKVSVLVAKKDVSVGTKFSTDNVGSIKIDKDSVLDTHITDFKKLENTVAETTIYKNEIISTQRVENEKGGKEKYALSIKPSNVASGLEEGDMIRVFVKPRSMSQLFEVIDVKDIEKIYMKSTSSGKETNNMESIRILASDKELELYERAVSLGDIVIVAYNDLSDIDRAEIIEFDEAATLIEQVIEQAKSRSKAGNYFGAIHQVKKGDTWDTLSQEYKKTTDEIKELNPVVKDLREGELIKVN